MSEYLNWNKISMISMNKKCMLIIAYFASDSLCDCIADIKNTAYTQQLYLYAIDAYKFWAVRKYNWFLTLSFARPVERKASI